MSYGTITIESTQPPKEGIASGTIYPGMILERTSAADTVKPHATEGGRVNGNLVAIEDVLQGNGITTAYTATNRCYFRSFLPGDVVNAYIASGQNIAIGDKLCSNGAGYLEKEVKDSSSADMDRDTFGVALVAVNATSAAARTLVEVA